MRITIFPRILVPIAFVALMRTLQCDGTVDTEWNSNHEELKGFRHQEYLRHSDRLDEENKNQDSDGTTSRLLGTSRCISTDRQLRSAVRSAPKSSSQIPLVLNLCRPEIIIENGGINLSNKYIDLRCKILTRTNQHCVFNGKGKSRIFYGENTKLIATGIDFVNAKDKVPDSSYGGSALAFGKKSNITLNQCHIKDNTGGSASAIYIWENSIIKLKGSSYTNPMIISNNIATYTGTIGVFYSTFIATNVIVTNNDVGAISIIDSKANMENVSFLNNNALDMIGAIYVVNSTISMNRFQVKSNRDAVWGSTYVSISKASFTNCQFMNNTVDGSFISAQSKVNFTNCTFYKNDGVDLWITDSIDPKKGGSYVSCDGNNNVFCDGLGTLNSSNTNCITKGIIGKPGIGHCKL